MEERVSLKIHKITINNRKSGTITGVSDVVSFDPEQIILDTVNGVLTIKGTGLHVKRLSVEKGEVDVEGKIDSFLYKDQGRHSGNESIISRIFG